VGHDSEEDRVIHKSAFPDQPIPDQTLTEYVFAGAGRRLEKAAVIEGQTGRTLSYGALTDAIRRLGGGLAAAGFGPGHMLAILAPNIPEYATVLHGTALAGGAVTTINPTYTAREVHHQLVDSGATILLTTSISLHLATEAAAGTAVETIAVIGGDSGGVPSWTNLMGDPLTGQVPVDLNTVVVLPYSSGTTGLPKGVMLSHRNLVSNLVQITAAADITDSETIVAVLPFFHIYGMQVLMNLGLSIGSTIVTMPRFELGQFLRLHQDYGATRAIVAPPMVLALAKDPLVDEYDVSRLTIVSSGAAPLSAELAREAEDRLGCEVVQGYGMTELSPTSHRTPRGRSKPGSVGTPIPNTETMIVDPGSGEPVGVNESGEIWVRGPQVMLGYLNNPSATAATIDAEGWLHTGDIGYIDEDGYLFIVDRLKELIKYKGFQVPPAELEAALLTHPAVADAAVIGVPDVDAGEVPVAFVQIRSGHDVSEDAIASYVASQVAHYKQVRKVTFVEGIPKSPSGKILRRVLRDAAVDSSHPQTT
jgi:acyl-CoA synthetase (AMP-forming)/AMP-acid ligase II